MCIRDRPFCALDYPLRLVELNALEQGSGELYKGCLLYTSRCV